MLADYSRYLCEFNDSDKLAANADRAEQLYLQAKAKAATAFKSSCHPLRLGVELNLSVFYYEIKGDTKKAIDIAKETYQMIEGQLQDLQTGDEEYNDSATIMQLLYENLNMWTAEYQEEQQASQQNQGPKDGASQQGSSPTKND